MIEPKEIEIDGKTFILSKFPATAGREIIVKYPISGMPKLGDYQVNEETMFKLMSYVAVPMPGSNESLRLTTRALVDNHTGNWETLLKVEGKMLEYNCSFFRDGRISILFDEFVQTVQQWTTKISTVLSGRLSRTAKRR